MESYFYFILFYYFSFFRKILYVVHVCRYIKKEYGYKS